MRSLCISISAFKSLFPLSYISTNVAGGRNSHARERRERNERPFHSHLSFEKTTFDVRLFRNVHFKTQVEADPRDIGCHWALCNWLIFGFVIITFRKCCPSSMYDVESDPVPLCGVGKLGIWHPRQIHRTQKEKKTTTTSNMRRGRPTMILKFFEIAGEGMEI